MKTWKINGLLIAFLSILAVAPSVAQKAGGAAPAQPAAQAGPPRATISLYRIAPGKHVEFLKFMAAREALDKEVGAAATQWYAHVDGDSWDFAAVAPTLEPVAQAALDRKLEAAAKQKGLSTGPKAAIEIRQYLAQHTDTMVVGPMTAAQIVDAVTK